MITKHEAHFLDREAVYTMLSKEDEYAFGWAEGKESVHPGFPAHVVNRRTGQPYTEMEWVVFAEKYLDDAKLAMTNYTPDMRAVRIRMLKAASLLVTALQVHGQEEDLRDIAGVPSNNYPILHGGLQTLKKEKLGL